jgi:hypothetical protein
MAMDVRLDHETYHIKNGWAAWVPQLGCTAHGYSEEAARLNLARCVKLFLQPFQREGTLESTINRMGLKVDLQSSDGKIVVTLQ